MMMTTTTTKSDAPSRLSAVPLPNPRSPPDPPRPEAVAGDDAASPGQRSTVRAPLLTSHRKPTSTAFTVDLDDEADNDDERRRRLALSDRIRRFAPAKKMCDSKTAESDSPSKNGSAAATEVADERNEVASDAGTYTIEDDPDQQQLDDLLDEAGADGGDAVDEDEDDRLSDVIYLSDKIVKRPERGDESGGTTSRSGIGKEGDDRISSRDWVNLWAANNPLLAPQKKAAGKGAAETSGSDGRNHHHHHAVDYGKDDDEELVAGMVSGGSGLSSLNAQGNSSSSAASSSSRRKLPAVPKASGPASSSGTAEIDKGQQRKGVIHRGPRPSPPPLPTRSAADDMLKDTISLMVSMEARIASSSAANSVNLAEGGGSSRKSVRPGTSRPSPAAGAAAAGGGGGLHSTPPPPPPGSAASIEAAIKAKDLEAWKRRKNYNPLKAAAGGSSSGPGKQSGNCENYNNSGQSGSNGPSSLRQKSINRSGLQYENRRGGGSFCNELDDSFSEGTTGSDLDVGVGSCNHPQNRHQQQHLPLRQLVVGGQSSSSATRSNRAFALRHLNSHQSSGREEQLATGGATRTSSPKRTPSQDSFSKWTGDRSNSGFSSAFNKNNNAPVKLGPQRSALGNKPGRGNGGPLGVSRMVGDRLASASNASAGRSSSSLSSREMEFQAWKRRKNYDPQRSAIASGRNIGAIDSKQRLGPSKNTSIPGVMGGGQVTLTTRSIGHHHHPASMTTSVTTAHEGTTEGTIQDNLLRSASFHYPDGLSKVKLNVYTSEEDEYLDYVPYQRVRTEGTGEQAVAMAMAMSSNGGEGQGEFLSGLYEVNDDELILAIGGGPDPSGFEHRDTQSSFSGSFSEGNCWPRHLDQQHPQSYHYDFRRAPLTTTASTGGSSAAIVRSPPARSSGNKLEALDNLVISTIFSVSAKLCHSSRKLMVKLQEHTTDKDHLEYLDTLLYILEDVEPPMSPSKKTSRELAGTLRNLKKVEQALETLLVSGDQTASEDEDCSDEDQADDDDDGDEDDHNEGRQQSAPRAAGVAK